MIFFEQIKENIFEKVTKIVFPNGDVILYSFGINSDIMYSTKNIKSDILEYVMFQNNHIFFLLPQILL